jgi:AraC-like DNA-binding protein
MSNSYKAFQQLTGIRIFEYAREDLLQNLPYDERTNRRMQIDVEMMCKEVETVDSFIVHAIYPHCYTIVWRPKMTSEVIFSEILYTAEKAEIICCERCHRVIDVKMFKRVTQELIQIVGEQLLKMLKPADISHRYTTRSTSTDNFCRDAILSEIHEELCEQPLRVHIREIVRALATDEVDVAQKTYDHVLTHLKQDNEGIPPSETIQGQFAYFMTAFAYELAEAFPNYRQNIFQMHQVGLAAFLKKMHYTNQIIFAQTYLFAYTKLVSPISTDQMALNTHRALQIIHNQYAGAVTLMSVAKQLKVQTAYLSRQFKKDVGQTFTQYVMGYRLKRAVVLMCETNLPITEIAIMVGFDSSAYFSTCFKNSYQVSPSTYRRKCLR